MQRIGDSLKAVYGKKIKWIRSQNIVSLAEIKSDSNLLASNINDARSTYTDINRLSGIRYVEIDSVSKSIEKGKKYYLWKKEGINYCEKISFIAAHIFWDNLIGFLITAIALSLGAPFWFDMLNKLVSIRGAGLKPEEKKVTDVEIDIPVDVTDAGNKNIEILDEDSVDVALRIYGDQIREIDGVLNVARSYYLDDKKIKECVQVNVQDKDSFCKKLLTNLIIN